MEIRILTQKSEMLAQLDIVKQLYPDFTIEKYGTLLDEMLKANYQQVIVTKNNSRLRPPSTSYYQVSNGQTSFPISETTVYPNVDIGTLEIYVNGIIKPINTVWDLNAVSNQIVFSAGFLKTNDVIAIVVKKNHDYLIENDRLVLISPLLEEDRYTITTFTNHNPDFIRTDRFDATASGQYTMQRPVLDSSYVWVTYNGKPLVANVDYAVETNNRTVILRDGLFNNPEYQNSTVTPIYELNSVISIGNHITSVILCPNNG
jgi:LysM repeat protein